MYDLSWNGYTNDNILSLLRSNRTISYRFELLDKDDLSIGEVSASGSIDFNSDATIKRAGSLSIKEMSDIDFLSDRIRPYMRLQTPKGIVEYPLGVFLLSSPTRRASGGMIERTIDCYDKAQILVDDKFAQRKHFPAGTTYVSAVLNILESAGIANAEIAISDKEMATATEFAVGTTKADAIKQLLKAINYNDLWFDAQGICHASAYVDPQNRAVECSYMTDKQSIVLPGAEEQLDIYAAPNKIVRYLENAERGCLISSSTNTDPASKLSTVSRGRVIVDVEALDDIADQATLDAYVQRVAAEKKIYQQIVFSTAAMPMHEYLDCLYISNKDLDISGKYIETSWTLELRTGGTMSHTARRAVSI